MSARDSARHGRGSTPGPRSRAQDQQRGSDRPRTPAAAPETPATARSVAYAVVRAVSESDAYANLLLPKRLAEARLSAADAALATELTYGTLRQRGTYDAIIERAAGRPLAEIDEPLQDVLRLGAHQLLNMRVPSHAAVSETVNLAKQVGGRGQAGFVNAVMRTISRREPDDWRAELRAEATTGEQALAIEHAHPEWIVRAFRQVLTAEGREAELPAALVADNVSPRVTLAALPGRGRRDSIDGSPTPYSPVGVTLAQGDPGRVAAVRAGEARVQDEGSQLAALALSRASEIRPGERWLDLCAGPGGKAALLAAEAEAGGASLVANEVVPARAELVADALAGFPGTEVVTSDGRTLGAEHPGEFDRVLLDAPCSGLGALRRRPEARWRKSALDLGPLTALQDSLLASAIETLIPGGLLAYVTCSPHVAETRAVVKSALRRHPDMELVDTPAVVQQIAGEPLDLPPGTAVQLWPHRHGTDAMFIQLMRKLDPISKERA